MKTIKVVAAIIRHDDKIFATQRGYGEFKDGWEFPGGKIEEGGNFFILTILVLLFSSCNFHYIKLTHVIKVYTFRIILFNIRIYIVM